MTGFVHFRLLASVGLSVAVISLGVPALGPAVAQPMGQTPQSGGANPVVTYRDTGGHVHLVRFSSYAGDAIRPSDTDLSAATAAPPATRTPTGYSSFEGATPVEHVDYRAQGGHVIELWKRQADDDWTLTDLTDAAHTKATAAGDVVGWGQAYPLQRQWVAYRGSDRHVHALTRAGSTQPWEDIDLSAKAKSGTDAASDPTMFVDSPTSGGSPILVYRGTDDQVHILAWVPGQPPTSWRDTDVSAKARSVYVPVGRPYGWASSQPATVRDELHVVFRTKGGHVAEIFGRGSRWKDENLSSHGHTDVLAASDIQGSVGTDELGQDFEIIQYRGKDGDLHRMFYRWLTYVELPSDVLSDVSTGLAVSKLGFWLKNQDTADTVYVAGGHLWASERFWGGEVTTDTDLTKRAGTLALAPGSGTGGYFTGGE